jgi:hypothetical protein
MTSCAVLVIKQKGGVLPYTTDLPQYVKVCHTEVARRHSSFHTRDAYRKSEVGCLSMNTSLSLETIMSLHNVWITRVSLETALPHQLVR